MVRRAHFLVLAPSGIKYIRHWTHSLDSMGSRLGVEGECNKSAGQCARPVLSPCRRRAHTARTLATLPQTHHSFVNRINDHLSPKHSLDFICHAQLVELEKACTSRPPKDMNHHRNYQLNLTSPLVSQARTRSHKVLPSLAYQTFAKRSSPSQRLHLYRGTK